MIIPEFHTSREKFDDDDDDGVAMRPRNINVDIACSFILSHPSRTHVIQRIEHEYWTRPHGLRDAGKLIGILMVLLCGGDLRVQDEARKLAASASTSGRLRESKFGESEREETRGGRAWFNRKGSRTLRRGGASLQRIKSSGNLHRSASQDERRRQFAFLQGSLEILTRMSIRDVEI